MRIFRAARRALLVFAAFAALAASAATPSPRVSARPAIEGMFDGAWEVAVDFPGEGRFTVLDERGEIAAGPYRIKEFPVPHPAVWTDEAPHCHTLVAEADGVEKRVRFAFRSIAAEGGRLVVNGRKVRVKLGPKSLNGNAAVAGAMDPDEALAAGVYLLDGATLASVEHEVAMPDDDATRWNFRDWSVSPTNYFGRFAVRNGNAFSTSEGVELFWDLLLDGEREGGDEIRLPRIEPGAEAVFETPAEAQRARFSGRSVSVRFRFVRDGREIARDQIDLVRSAAPMSAAEISPGFWTGRALAAGDFEGECAARGCPQALRAEGWLFSSPAITAIAPAMEGSGAAAECAVLGRPAYLCGERFKTVKTVSEAKFRPPYRATPCEISRVASRWTLYAHGTVECRAAGWSPSGARLGYAFDIAGAGGVEWLGPGPRNTAGGDSAGAFSGRWERGADALPLKAEGVSGVKCGGVAIRTSGAPFAVLAEDAGDGVVRVSLFAQSGGALAFAVSAGGRDLSALSPGDAGDGWPESLAGSEIGAEALP